MVLKPVGILVVVFDGFITVDNALVKTGKCPDGFSIKISFRGIEVLPDLRPEGEFVVDALGELVGIPADDDPSGDSGTKPGSNSIGLPVGISSNGTSGGIAEPFAELFGVPSVKAPDNFVVVLAGCPTGFELVDDPPDALVGILGGNADEIVKLEVKPFVASVGKPVSIPVVALSDGKVGILSVKNPPVVPAGDP